MRTLLWLLYAGRSGYELKPGSFNVLAVDLLLDDTLKLWVRWALPLCLRPVSRNFVAQTVSPSAPSARKQNNSASYLL
jgi:hypothetical protein